MTHIPTIKRSQHQQFNECWSISVDSTPEICHVDQLTFCILRYVKSGSIGQRFLDFTLIHSHSHASEYLADIVLNYLKDNEIDILKCRGQTYDNANNMAGHCNGLQSRIRTVNETAAFAPCAHCLD